MKAKPSPTRELELLRLPQGATLSEVSAESGVSEALLLELLGDAPRAQKPAAKRKPVYTKDGQRLGKLALWT